MKNRCVIVGGASIDNYEYLRTLLNEDDFMIYCDCGLRHMEALGLKPDLIVGDFDSYDNPLLKAETIVLPCEKDDTDTMYGLKEGIKRGFQEFVLIGVIGQRLDHSLANLYSLVYLDELNLKATIIDDYSDIEIVSREAKYIEDSYAYFSLINLSGVAKGINIYDAKYPLVDGTIEPGYQYGVSNEVIKGKRAKVLVKEGRLLLIKDR